MKEKDGKQVPNCVPIDEELKAKDIPAGTSWKTSGNGWAAKNRAGKTNYWYGKDPEQNKKSADRWRMSEHTNEAREKISQEISDTILKKMNYPFDPSEFHMGMNVEMEHQDLTNGNVVMTAKIAAAHLKENPKYYTLLKKHVEKNEQGLPSGIGLNLPGGSINAAPKPKDVKKMRNALDSEK
jgi:hypothetical protein